MWQFIDAERVIREFKSRIFHVHAKDLRIDKEGLYENGVMSAGMGWQVPRLPGLGQVNWASFISTLYEVGYDYVLSIEHEDRAFEGDEELVKRGFLDRERCIKAVSSLMNCKALTAILIGVGVLYLLVVATIGAALQGVFQI